MKGKTSVLALSMLDRANESLELLKEIVNEKLDLAIVNETIQHYEKIIKNLEVLERDLRTEIDLFNPSSVKNPTRTKNELYQTYLNIQNTRIALATLLLKLKSKGREENSGITLNINFKTQENPEDYIRVELED